jgi:hypothetical protein
VIRNAKCRGCVLLLSGLTAFAALAAIGLSSDSLFDRGFGKALALSRAGLSFSVAQEKRTTSAVTTGDEGFWLTQAEVQSPAPFANPLAVGDRITIAGRDGRERRLEVVNLKAVGGNASGALGPHGRLLLVSCRVTGQAAEPSETTVRFLIEAAGEQPAPQRAKAL